MTSPGVGEVLQTPKKARSKSAVDSPSKIYSYFLVVLIILVMTMSSSSKGNLTKKLYGCYFFPLVAFNPKNCKTRTNIKKCEKNQY